MLMSRIMTRVCESADSSHHQSSEFVNLLMLQSLPAHLLWQSQRPSSWSKRPWPEQSGRHWLSAAFLASQFRPIQPRSHRQWPSWSQVPWPEHFGSGQCSETEIRFIVYLLTFVSYIFYFISGILVILISQYLCSAKKAERCKTEGVSEKC